MRKIRISLLVAAFAVATFYLTPVRHVLASGVQALASVIAGGTGRSTLGANGVVIGEGTSPVNVTAAGTSGQVLTSNGAGMDPTFQAAAGGGSAGAGAVSYSASGLTITANTYFFPPGGGLASSTTEANVDVGAPAGTFQNFNAAISQAVGMGNSAVFTWRKNGADQTVTCTISGAAATSCSDTSHSFATANGDLIDVKLVTTGTIVVTPNIVFITQFGAATASGLVLLSDQLLGSATGTVTFSSIPGSYKLLKLFIAGACSSATQNQNIVMTLNADTGANYNRQFLGSSGSSPSAAQNLNSTPANASVSQVPCGTAFSTSVPSNFEITFWNYASTAFDKTYLSAGNASFTANTQASFLVYYNAGYWANTAAITSISLAPADASNFVTGSRFTLYGLN